MRRSIALGLFVLLFVDCAPRAAGAGPLRIGASFEWGRSELDSRFGGSLWLIVPLERLASPMRASRFASPLAEEGPARTQRPVRAEQTPIADLRLARGAVRAARRASARETTERRLDGLGSRARVSAALPELMLRATRSTDQSLRLSPDERDVTVYDYTRTGGADLLLEARATWNLDRLVFADEELGVERLRLEHAKSEERLIERVLALWSCGSGRGEHSALRRPSQSSGCAPRWSRSRRRRVSTRSRQVGSAPSSSAERSGGCPRRPPRSNPKHRRRGPGASAKGAVNRWYSVRNELSTPHDAFRHPFRPRRPQKAR